jgi:shikimate dehydrogenase
VDPAPASRRALILGAGGAARAVVLALDAAGVRDIAIANRGRERAQGLAGDLVPIPLTVLDLSQESLRSALPRVMLLVNATALGWHAGETPLPLDLLALLPADAIVVDLTYRDTDLLLAARRSGRRTLDGLPMLVHQGARALELWTGRPAPLAVMRAAAEAARAARERAG